MAFLKQNPLNPLSETKPLRNSPPGLHLPRTEVSLQPHQKFSLTTTTTATTTTTTTPPPTPTPTPTATATATAIATATATAIAD